MAQPTAKKPAQVPSEKVEGAAAITQYNLALPPEHAAICNALRKELDAMLSPAASRIYYANPVWFVGENPVVGYHITAKQVVNLLFWSGQLFDEPQLKASGKFKAAQIQFKHESEIDLTLLRAWLNKAKTHVFDYNAMQKGKRAANAT